MPPTKPSVARLAALTQYAQCLRQHGYPDASDPDPQTGAIRDPAGPNPGERDPVAKQACEQCAAQAAALGQGLSGGDRVDLGIRLGTVTRAAPGRCCGSANEEVGDAGSPSAAGLAHGSIPQ